MLGRSTSRCCWSTDARARPRVQLALVVLLPTRPPQVDERRLPLELGDGLDGVPLIAEVPHRLGALAVLRLAEQVVVEPRAGGVDLADDSCGVVDGALEVRPVEHRAEEVGRGTVEEEHVRVHVDDPVGVVLDDRTLEVRGVEERHLRRLHHRREHPPRPRVLDAVEERPEEANRGVADSERSVVGEVREGGFAHPRFARPALDAVPEALAPLGEEFLAAFLVVAEVLLPRVVEVVVGVGVGLAPGVGCFEVCPVMVRERTEELPCPVPL
ncbi:hypothetical protein [Halospeciosus flavus]|uniref:hypothetical protein n=1 Tax=Halospeciosus flavus TaxID=3032283 RepID=UPI00361E1CA2